MIPDLAMQMPGAAIFFIFIVKKPLNIAALSYQK
jgi:hypothetical protein